MRHLSVFNILLRSALVVAILGTTPLFACQSWEGGPITTDVINNCINVEGTNWAVGPIHVRASGGYQMEINVLLSSVLTSTQNLANPGRFYFYADATSTINFNVQQDLMFQGTAVGATLLDLLVSFSGDGHFNFIISDSEEVAFTAIPGVTGGAQGFLVMDATNAGPQVKFERMNNTSNNNVDVVLGNRSGLTYLSTSRVSAGVPTGMATIFFDPTNSNANTGAMNLRVENGSFFVIDGHFLDNINIDYNFNDIDWGIPAGLDAIVTITNSSPTNSSAYLRVINSNQTLTSLIQNPWMDINPTTTQYGFILGANGQLVLANMTYLDYIGTATNQAVMPVSPSCIVDCADAEAQIKARNPSAFWVDGNTNPNSSPALINMLGSSAIYFRSGVDASGNVNEAGGFIISYTAHTYGAGNIVFDVEGLLDVVGNGTNALSVLSLQVTPTGCSVVAESTEIEFPSRTFTTDSDGNYLTYNSGAMLFNNRMNVIGASIVHTDQNHHIYERDNLGRPYLASGPTYIGGESFKYCGNHGPRPTIGLYNSIFRFNTDAGFTGVDIQVPNIPTAGGNNSVLRFYNNGREIDQGYGRYVIFGTNLGAYAADGGTLIDNNTYLDIFQTSANSPATPQTLQLQVGYNTPCITQGVPPVADITGQYAVQTIYLGNNSNIAVGTEVVLTPTFALTTTPTLLINGDFFSFETFGGSAALPETSGTTGQGGIFVDQNGTISITPFLRASCSCMVVKSANGVINLPSNQVLFHNRVGISQWNLNLNDPSQFVIIPKGQKYLSDYTLDWGAVTKNYDYLSTNSFVPYELANVPAYFNAPAVIQGNLQSIPIIQGYVGQFQAKRSRLGDMITVMIDGGHVSEFVFLLGLNTAEAPTAFIALQNNGFVGLGTRQRNIDSVSTAMVLGINGVTICPNGDCTVELNQNVIIDNVCHIVTGTAFGTNGTQNTLTIHSQDDYELRVKSTGVLDLTQFANPNQVIQFAGNARVVFEPGSKLGLGGGTILFTDNASIQLVDVYNDTLLSSTYAAGLNPILVPFIGQGTITMRDASSVVVGENTFLAIETDPTYSLVTTLTWQLQDNAVFQVGNNDLAGGGFQVGNTVEQGVGTAAVNFSLLINGPGAQFQINRQGFVGLGVGLTDKSSQIPDQWNVVNLFDTGVVNITLVAGSLIHNQIFSGTNSLASLLALGIGTNIGLTFNVGGTRILGGGNMVFVQGAQRSAMRTVLPTRAPATRTISVTSGATLDVERCVERYENGELESCQLRLEPNARLALGNGGLLVHSSSSSCTLRPEDIARLQACCTDTMLVKRSSSAHSARVLVPHDGVCDINHLRGANNQLILSGNVQIVLQPGATIQLQDGKTLLVNGANAQLVLDAQGLLDLDTNIAEPVVEHFVYKVNPTVDSTAGTISTDPLVIAGLMSSLNMLIDRSPAQIAPITSQTASAITVSGTGQNLFNFLSIKDIATYYRPQAAISKDETNTAVLAFLTNSGSLINRQNWLRIIGGSLADPVGPANSLNFGSVGINVSDSTDEIYNVIELQGAVSGL